MDNSSGNPKGGANSTPDNPQPSRSPTPAGASSNPGIYVSFFFIILLASAAATQFFGPYKGWADTYLSSSTIKPCMLKAKGAPLDIKERVRDTVKSTAAADKGKAKEDVAKKGDGVDDDDDAEAVKLPEKTDDELKFDELFDKYFKKMKMPSIGKKYKFKLQAGGEIDGILKGFSDGKIEIEQQYGKLGYPINVVHRSAYPELFPKRAAQILAQLELDRIIQMKAEAEKPKPAAKPDAQLAKADTPAPAKTVVVETLSLNDLENETAKLEKPHREGDFKYDPTFAETPPELKNTILTFGNWLKFQQKSMGLTMAEKVFAKQQGGHSVVYLSITPKFAKQDYDFRFGVADGMAKFWSFRCLDAKTVRSPNDAHIVFLDSSNNIVGGSTEKSGAEVWVKK